jgi:chaperonin GroEL (HSP60 family)
MNQGIHPSIVSAGYLEAGRQARKILQDIVKKVPALDETVLKQAAITTMNSKGIAGQKENFADLAFKALSHVHEPGANTFQRVQDITIIKKKGLSISESEIVKGVILEKEPVHPAMPKSITNAKVALVAQSFEIKKTEFTSDLRISDPSQIQEFLDQEERTLKKFADTLAALGVTVVINQKGIEDMAAHFLNKAGICAIKSVTKSDMIKLSKATGATIVEDVTSLNEGFLGMAGLVEFKKFGSDDLCFVSECQNPKSVSILIRGGVSSNLDESERTLHDALCVIASLMDKAEIVGGGGAVEMELASRLLAWAAERPGKKALAYEAFARALEIIPITLAENAGMDPVNVVAELRAKHAQPGNEFWGLELYAGEVQDNTNVVIEPAANIDSILKSSTELAVMIMRIDEMVRAQPSRGGPGGGMGGMGDMDY